MSEEFLGFAKKNAVGLKELFDKIQNSAPEAIEVKIDYPFLGFAVCEKDCFPVVQKSNGSFVRQGQDLVVSKKEQAIKEAVGRKRRRSNFNAILFDNERLQDKTANIAVQGFIPILAPGLMYCAGWLTRVFGFDGFQTVFIATGIITVSMLIYCCNRARKRGKKMKKYKYKCGHTSSIILLDDNPLCFAAWLEWNNTVGRNGTREKCFACWGKNIQNQKKR